MWKPIETAPKDGTRIMLAKFGKTFDANTWKETEDVKLFWAGAGFWSKKWNNWNDGFEPCGLASPTHWFEIPELPKN